MSRTQPEAWLRGPVPGVPPLLNPAAHALQHAADDAALALEGLSPDMIWRSPGDAASIGYHVRHLIGALWRFSDRRRASLVPRSWSLVRPVVPGPSVRRGLWTGDHRTDHARRTQDKERGNTETKTALDRLLTYARGESLTREQLEAKACEGEPGDPPATAAALLSELTAAIDRALDQLHCTPEASLLDARAVGREQLPSTVGDLIFHAAEHSARHAGQAITTAKALRIAD